MLLVRIDELVALLEEELTRLRAPAVDSPAMPDDVLPGDLEDYPPELRSAGKVEEVLAWIRVAFPQPSIRKKKLYAWAKSLGLSLDVSYYRRLE